MIFFLYMYIKLWQYCIIYSHANKAKLNFEREQERGRESELGHMAKILIYIRLYMTLEHRRSHKQHRYICSNSQQYIVWLKMINVYFMPKVIRILRSCSMKIFSTFPTINIIF